MKKVYLLAIFTMISLTGAPVLGSWKHRPLKPYETKRASGEIITGFYDFASRGYLDYMRNTLYRETFEQLYSVDSLEELGRLGELFEMAHQVREGRIKVLFTSVTINLQSSDGRTARARVRYTVKITNRADNTSQTVSGVDIFTLKYDPLDWQISDIKKEQ